MTSAGWLRASGLVVAVGSIAWALVGTPAGETSEARADVLLPISVGVAAGLVALLAATPYRDAAIWFALAIVGHAATLQFIEAGPALRYQHYPPFTTLLEQHPLLMMFVAAQAGFVAMAWWRWALRAVHPTLPLSRPRLMLSIVLSAATAATVSADPTRYLGELAWAAALQVLAIATLALAVLAIPERAATVLAGRLDRALDRADRDGTTSGRFAWTAAATATGLAAMLAIWSYQRHPHLPDEVVYLQHARYLAAGMLEMPAPPVPAAFELDLMSYERDRWFSPVPVGWPAVLALGAFAGVPWLVNPILAGLSILLCHALLVRLYSPRIARLGTVLLAVSPWFLFLAMSYMTHMATLTCTVLAAWGMTRAQSSGRLGWGIVAGGGVGITSLIRPLDGVLVGVLIGLWALGLVGRRLAVPAMVGLALGTVATGALVYPYNRAMTGDGLTFPINAYIDKTYAPKANAYGFGPERGLGWAIDPNPGHSPVDGLININLNAFGLNTDLFGWSTGSLLLVALLLCSGKLTGMDRRMIAAILIVVTGYFFYYFSGGPEFGARYWFPIIVPLAALTARGLSILEQAAGARARIAVAALVVMTLVNYLPWRALDKYRHMRGMRPDVQSLAAEQGFASDLVLVRGARFPDYSSAAILNPVDLQAPATVYAWDRSPEVRAETLRAYPGRRVWVVDGPTRTGAGFRVVAGPIAPGTLTVDADQ